MADIREKKQAVRIVVGVFVAHDDCLGNPLHFNLCLQEVTSRDLVSRSFDYRIHFLVVANLFSIKASFLTLMAHYSVHNVMALT
jgi:hypothetical protein